MIGARVVQPVPAPGERGAHKIVYVTNNIEFFASHRLVLATAARAKGYQPSVITGVSGSPTLGSVGCERTAAAGIPRQAVPFSGSSVNPLSEARGLLMLIKRLSARAPDLVHCASPKGNIYGGIAARFVRAPAVVYAISGQGHLETNAAAAGLAKTVARQLARRLQRLAFRHPNKRVIVQNEDDRRSVIDSGLAREDEVRLVSGSGVNLQRFRFSDMRAKEPIVVFPARLLRDKGIDEFVRAARLLKMRFPEWRFVLAGTADYRNPSAIAVKEIRRWEEEGVVEWLGHVQDMPDLFSRASIACLPSHREGLPMALLEAAASGCAVVTTDAVGSREAIVHGHSGLLVPPHDPEALSVALGNLMQDGELRTRYGTYGRRLAEERFCLEKVTAQIMDIYAELLGEDL